MTRKGGKHPPTTTEMTGRNRALNAARNGPGQRQLLRKERLADGNLILHLTALANGCPVSAYHQCHPLGLTRFLVEIQIDSLNMIATPDHPFYTVDKEWKPAGQLVEGDILFDEIDSAGRMVTSVVHWREDCTVYNMEVDGLHNFFITGDGILTHNVNAGYNHFFQNSFVKAVGKKGLRYGKESLTIARKMGKRAHTQFHKEFNEFLAGKNMLPSKKTSSEFIIATKGLDFEGLVREFRPFFNSHPNQEWKKWFEEEVKALRKDKRTLK